MFSVSQLGTAGLLIAERKVGVAVNAGEIASSGDLNRSADRDSSRYNLFVNAEAPVLIALDFHGPTC